MLAFVNCNHFPVRRPDVPLYGWGRGGNLFWKMQHTFSECSKVHQHHTFLLLEMWIPKLYSNLKKLGMGFWNLYFLASSLDFSHTTQIWEYTKSTWWKRPRVPNGIQFNSEPSFHSMDPHTRLFGIQNGSSTLKNLPLSYPAKYLTN